VPVRQYRCVARCSCGYSWEAEADSYGAAETEAKEGIAEHRRIVGALPQ
jgi:hypothetical protein